MYKLEIDGINKTNRGYFKSEVLSISRNFSIKFNKDNAIIKYHEPFNMDVAEKGRAISILKKIIWNFRIYQFNQGGNYGKNS